MTPKHVLLTTMFTICHIIVLAILYGIYFILLFYYYFKIFGNSFLKFVIEVTLVYNLICSTCTTLYFYFCIHYSILTTKKLVSIHHHTVDLLYPFHPPPSSFPSGNPYSVLCICVFVFVWLTDSLIDFCLFVIFCK